ncbi:MAG: GNAT family N-acetyltransferase, partial [Coprobacillaceae bacterium]
MELKLVFPEYLHKDAMEIFVKEIKEHDQGSVNGVGVYENYMTNYNQWIKKEKQLHLGIHLDPGFVPGTTFLYILNGVVIGTINIRHCLNENLLKMGGNIGYSIHPKYRKQGYATKMLKEALLFCRQWEIWPVLLTCNKDNIASKKTIERCGGKLENDYYDENTKETILRF